MNHKCSNCGQTSEQEGNCPACGVPMVKADEGTTPQGNTPEAPSSDMPASGMPVPETDSAPEQN